MITILGPTASGKTKLAAKLAVLLHGEVISADSRQVFRGMTIGTGKDYDDFVVEGHLVPYHLIDIEDPGAEYNIFRYQQDFLAAYNDIKLRGKYPFFVVAPECTWKLFSEDINSPGPFPTTNF